MTGWRQSPTSRPMKGQSGFTLLEVTVALAIAGLFLAMLYEVFAGSFQAWDRSGRVVDGHASLASTRDALRLWLGQAQCCDLDVGEASVATFSGASDSLMFATYMPDHFAQTGMQPVLLEVRRQAGHFKLTLQFGDDERTLLSGLAEMKFSYDCSGQNLDRLSCRDEWQQTDGLPSNVLVTAKFQSSDRRVWTPLLIAVSGVRR